MAEAERTRQGSPLRCDERATERTALTEPSAPARCKSHEAGALNEKIWF